MPVARNATAFLLGDERRHRVFIAASDDALELHAPRLHAVAREAQLAERNAILRGPAAGVHGRRDCPYGIPRVVVLVDGLHFVATHAEWIDVEAERRAMVVVAVEHDAEPIGI